jgi:hypothetical protein
VTGRQWKRSQTTRTALARLVRLQCRQCAGGQHRGRAGFREHHDLTGVHAGHLDDSRLPPHQAHHGCGRRHRHRGWTVGITPAAGYVSPTSALIIGLRATFPSYFAIIWRSRSSLDDSLDVFAGHGLGGITGALLTGVFAEKAWGGTEGLLFGNPKQLAIQAVAIVSCLVYTGVVSFVIVKGLSLVMKLRVSTKTEGRGLDVALHGEEAYTTGEGAVLILNKAQTSARLELVPTSATA